MSLFEDIAAGLEGATKGFNQSINPVQQLLSFKNRQEAELARTDYLREMTSRLKDINRQSIIPMPQRIPPQSAPGPSYHLRELLDPRFQQVSRRRPPTFSSGLRDMLRPSGNQPARYNHSLNFLRPV